MDEDEFIVTSESSFLRIVFRPPVENMILLRVDRPDPDVDDEQKMEESLKDGVADQVPFCVVNLLFFSSFFQSLFDFKLYYCFLYVFL